MSFVDHYSTLGLTSEASDSDIKSAYRLAARRFHPDVNKSPGANIIFGEFNAAYEILADPTKRQLYDQEYKKIDDLSPGIHMQVFFSRPRIKRLGQQQLLYVLAKLQPRLEKISDSHAPLNLCIVVDRSKSMQGSRLRHVKQAAHAIIDDLDDNDVISIVSFSDRAEVVISPQRMRDRRNMKARVSSLRADGSTAMYEGLDLGLSQVERYRSTQYVNHLILITDGRTYLDEDKCLGLADDARMRGVGISGMGIGQDWNDQFLDDLTSRTGGASAYISTGHTVTKFLHNHVKRLATAYAERSQLVVAPTKGVELKEITRIAPDPARLSFEKQPIALGTIDSAATTAVVFKFLIDTTAVEYGDFHLGRLQGSGDVLGRDQRVERIVEDLTIEITGDDVTDEPPPEIIDALSKLRLYQLQENAREAVDNGDFEEATRQLNYLATRLLEEGQEGLAQAALHEARMVKQTQALSDEGTKALKYGTRALINLETELFTNLLTEEASDD
ncbi:MAG: VWA domain-containing protein [Anaerolineae bacterium]